MDEKEVNSNIIIERTVKAKQKRMRSSYLT